MTFHSGERVSTNIRIPSEITSGTRTAPVVDTEVSSALRISIFENIAVLLCGNNRSYLLRDASTLARIGLILPSLAVRRFRKSSTVVLTGSVARTDNDLSIGSATIVSTASRTVVISFTIGSRYSVLNAISAFVTDSATNSCVLFVRTSVLTTGVSAF